MCWQHNVFTIWVILVHNVFMSVPFSCMTNCLVVYIYIFNKSRNTAKKALHYIFEEKYRWHLVNWQCLFIQLIIYKQCPMHNVSYVTPFICLLFLSVKDRKKKEYASHWMMVSIVSCWHLANLFQDVSQGHF